MPDQEPSLSELLTLKEAAEYSGLSDYYLRDIAQSGRLRAYKIGHFWVTTRQAIDEYIATRRETGFYREDLGT
ncbi:MAG: helix-turn-helix domain-containing protein [Chloroflexi bacterium]|nr:helix-turn-helix domain-containing protein [Chloroflexota bacterium]MBU1747217.1 helix-turn-helix domain-containing protein [Chloroflexota bacterium]